MKLTWKPLSKFDATTFSDKDTKPGVYFWGFRINQNFIPYSVGIAQYIPHRIAEHLNCIISGKYTIYHKDHLEEFYRYKNEKVAGSELLFIPYWSSNFPDFLKKRDELSEHIKFMVDHFEYTYAHCDLSAEAEIRLTDVEKYVINIFGTDKLANTRGGHGNIMNIKHEGDKEVVELLANDKVIDAS